MSLSSRDACMVWTAVVVLTATACGPSQSGPSGSSNDSSVNAAAVSSAKAAVAKLLERPKTLHVEDLPSKPTPGKTIDFVACGLPVCVAFGADVQKAARAVGWNYKLLNAGGTPETIAAAYDQAVRDNPGGVIGSGGFSPSLFSNQLSQLAAAHVPVMLNVVDSNAPGITGIILDKSFVEESGKEMGQWILADSNGKNAHIAIISTPLTPIYAAAHAGLEGVIKDGCTSCSIDTYSSFQFGDIGTTLPAGIVTYLTSHPNVNYLFFDFNLEVNGVPAALDTAGLAKRVKITSTDITQPEAGYLKDGTMAATSANPWVEAMWGAVDGILRADQKATAAPIQWPHQILNGSNLVSLDRYPLVENYESTFKAAWKVG